MDLGTTSGVTEISRPKRLSNSRYAVDTALADGTRVYTPTWRRPAVVTHDDDTFHTVSPGEENRMDLIAWNYYRDVTLWWVIALYNGISHAQVLPAGTVLRVPTLAVVFSEIVER